MGPPFSLNKGGLYQLEENDFRLILMQKSEKGVSGLDMVHIKRHLILSFPRSRAYASGKYPKIRYNILCDE